ncbi:hypothetical protein P168DRAFT_38100 [Aspergillus campestris IBT 28561]|uniref:Secreted protein n=1 Tax=Aspergillus campestris (strain IBT 28561) TaxID=1392248 RepID=A0A2I1CWD2_ASPC2|nr:uncharacterized protein P168DRAFT_38100 [Aspergillus campestris IBT 28561]PKY01933.1 hypothetical protein P168DRAFT_38100 [Aspergillus campestris IBT 28561]
MGSLLVPMMVHRMCTRLFFSLYFFFSLPNDYFCTPATEAISPPTTAPQCSTRIFTPSTEAPGFLYRQFQSPNNGRLRVNVIDTRDEGAWGQGPLSSINQSSSDSLTHCMHACYGLAVRAPHPARPTCR